MIGTTTKGILVAFFACAAVSGCSEFGYADPNGGGAAPVADRGVRGGGGGVADEEGASSTAPAELGSAERIASDEPGPASLSVYDRTVYVANESEGTIKKVASDGGSLSLVTRTSSPVAVVAVFHGVYFVRGGSSGVLFRLANGASSPTSIASGFAYANRLLVTDEYVFLSLEDSVLRFTSQGSSKRAIASGQATPKGLATDGSRIYWANADAGEVRSASVDGSDVRLVLSGLDSLCGVAVDSSSVYTCEESGGRIAKIAKSSTTRKATFLVSGQEVITSIAADNGYVYWTTSGGTVARVATSGGSVQTLAEEQEEPQSLTVASDGIYWVNVGTGDVMRIAK